jgi:putative flippase GtrA
VTLGRPAKFVLVGAAGYAVNLAAFALLYAAGVAYLATSIVSYFFANSLMYLGNRYFTFGLGHQGFWGAYLRYVGVGVVVAGLNAALLALLVEVGALHATLAQAISLLALTPIAFVLNKRWTFQIES